MSEKNSGKEHGLGVTHQGAFAPHTHKKMVKGSQHKAVKGQRGARGAQVR